MANSTQVYSLFATHYSRLRRWHERRRCDTPQASPEVSNMVASSASVALLPAQTTNWKAWK